MGSWDSGYGIGVMEFGGDGWIDVMDLVVMDLVVMDGLM